MQKKNNSLFYFISLNLHNKIIIKLQIYTKMNRDQQKKKKKRTSFSCCCCCCCYALYVFILIIIKINVFIKNILHILYLTAKKYMAKLMKKEI